MWRSLPAMGAGDFAEVAVLLVGIRSIELRRIGDVEAFRAELQEPSVR